MALDYSKLSDEELEAIANNDYSKLSDATLQAIAMEGSGSKVQSAEPGYGQVAGAVTGAVAPAGMYGPTGLPQLARDVAQASEPLIDAAKSAAAGYAKSPGKAIVDVGAAHLGLPPPYATYEAYQGGKNLLSAAAQTAGNLGEAFGRLPPSTVEQARPFVEALKPRDITALNELINKQGLEKALKSFQAPAYLTDEARAGLAAVQGAFPSTAQKVGQAVMPFVRGAAKVAGPVGMGYNLYEAGQAARDTELGQRLAQGQAQAAEQMFRGGMNQTYQGPQLSPQEAQNVLQSGSQRDIQYFGGQDKLSQMIRRKAAEKVLGPIAPGTF